MRVPELRGMPMDVAVEGFLAAVGHPDRPLGREREEARVDLERHVFTRSERAAHAGKHKAYLRLRQAKARRDLAQVLVQPLRGNVQLDAAVAPRDGKSGLRAQSRLVLHRKLVF